MATKKCPSCAEEILAEAKKCKHCGEPVSALNSTKISGGAAAIITIIAIVIILAVVVNLNQHGIDTSKAVNNLSVAPGYVPVAVASDKFSMSQYSKITDKMSYSEVCNVMGERGEECSSSSTEINGEKYTLTTYAWKNDSGSNVICMFQNDVLTNKGQFGLK